MPKNIEKYSENIQVRLDKETLKLLKILAKELGGNVSQAIRYCIKKQVEK